MKSSETTTIAIAIGVAALAAVVLGLRKQVGEALDPTVDDTAHPEAPPKNRTPDADFTETTGRIVSARLKENGFLSSVYTVDFRVSNPTTSPMFTSVWLQLEATGGLNGETETQKSDVLYTQLAPGEATPTLRLDVRGPANPSLNYIVVKLLDGGRMLDQRDNL